MSSWSTRYACTRGLHVLPECCAWPLQGSGRDVKSGTSQANRVKYHPQDEGVVVLPFGLHGPALCARLY